MIPILIVDDLAIVRRGLKQILAEEADMTVAGEAANVKEMLAFVRERRCDIVLAGMSMPGRGGLDIVKDLKGECPRLPVLVLSMYPGNQYAARAMKLGASGYLTKESTPAELVQAIRRIVAGGTYVSPSLAGKLALGPATGTRRPPHANLSQREYQGLCMIASGKSATVIAEELGLSLRTIQMCRSQILKKMGMKSNAELKRYAIRNRLVD